ncbi:hypothetical protein Nepgr_018442 [Nepenthes gracilis]|uniref:Uncharacterized protein n=1 Tax=Nepenthes gracilis TaxID=150966 RepID=A0AAD3STN9_NEPGR|nr:hypothetical protein Nepgr_018442 [Nepenthes gracilis]
MATWKCLLNADNSVHVCLKKGEAELMNPCTWGNKPTPQGTSSAPLPPPVATLLPCLSAAVLTAYERQLALSKMVGV